MAECKKSTKNRLVVVTLTEPLGWKTRVKKMSQIEGKRAK